MDRLYWTYLIQTRSLHYKVLLIEAHVVVAEVRDLQVVVTRRGISALPRRLLQLDSSTVGQKSELVPVDFGVGVLAHVQLLLIVRGDRLPNVHPSPTVPFPWLDLSFGNLHAPNTADA